jgi:hypothetical protein
MSNLNDIEIMVANGDKERAMKMLISTLQLNGNDIDAWLLLGEIIDDTEKKKDCYRQVLKFSANNSLALNKLRNLETSKIEPIENSATNPVDTQPIRHRNVSPKISVEQDARIKCPSCGNSMPSWYAVCDNCGYALVEPSKPIPYFAGGNNSKTYLNQCPKCHGKSVSTIGIGTIILHIILIFITSGLWLLVLIVWALVSPKRKGKYKCNACGYEWG